MKPKPIVPTAVVNLIDRVCDPNVRQKNNTILANRSHSNKGKKLQPKLMKKDSFLERDQV